MIRKVMALIPSCSCKVLEGEKRKNIDFQIVVMIIFQKTKH